MTSPVRGHRLPRRRLVEILRAAGPGLIAGASDNDPTTVASLAVIGSTTTYGLAWLVVLVIPMLMVVQAIAATVGVVTRKGLEDVVRHRYGRLWAYLALVLVLAVNVITLAADLEGGSAAMALLTGVGDRWFILPIALAAAAMLLMLPYQRLERYLRIVVLVFLAYILAAFLARPNWGDVLSHTLVPEIRLSGPFLAGALALLGTTLTSYAYVWEQIEASEQRTPLSRLGRARLDAAGGMVAAGVVFYFIVVGTGATLGVHHHPVQTAQDAAAALMPAAGRFASLLFGVGLLASAVIALPVLAGTSAYVLAEALGWKGNLDATFQQAPRFYTAVVISLAIGCLITLLGVSPIHLLFFSSIAGGLGTPVTLIMLMLVARDSRLMRARRIGRGLEIGGWLTAAVVTTACIAFLAQTLLGGGG